MGAGPAGQGRHTIAQPQQSLAGRRAPLLGSHALLPSRHRYAPLFELALASAIWAFSFGLIKRELGGLDPSFVGFARLAIALPLFLPWLKLRSIPVLARRKLLFIGAVQYGLAYSTYLFAYRFVDGYQVALLTVFTPIFVALILARRDSTRRVKIIGLAALAVVGAGVVQFRADAWRAGLIGFGLLQVANVCFAWGQVAYRDLRAELDVRDHEVFALLFAGGAAMTAITATIFGGWPSALLLDVRSATTILYLGAVASGLAFFLWNRAAVDAAPSMLAVMNNAKVPLGVAAAVLVFGEDADLPRLAIGGAIMLVAVVGARRSPRRVRSDGDPQG